MTNEQQHSDEAQVAGGITPSAAEASVLADEGVATAVAEEVRNIISPGTHFATLKLKYEETLVVPGQVFDLRGMPNDAALVSVSHFKQVGEAYPAGAYEHPCLRCSRIFVDDYFKRMHDEDCPAQEIRVEPGTVNVAGNPAAGVALMDALGGR